MSAFLGIEREAAGEGAGEPGGERRRADAGATERTAAGGGQTVEHRRSLFMMLQNFASHALTRFVQLKTNHLDNRLPDHPLTERYNGVVSACLPHADRHFLCSGRPAVLVERLSWRGSSLLFEILNIKSSATVCPHIGRDKGGRTPVEKLQIARQRSNQTGREHGARPMPFGFANSNPIDSSGSRPEGSHAGASVGFAISNPIREFEAQFGNTRSRPSGQRLSDSRIRSQFKRLRPILNPRRPDTVQFRKFKPNLQNLYEPIGQ